MDRREALIDIRAARRATIRRLEGKCDPPGLAAELLLARSFGRPRAWVLAHTDAQLEPGQAAALEADTLRLEQGEPLPYVLGRWEFFGLEFEVNRDVLIPRPETELLVETALDWLGAHPGRREALDVGTGSGCIAISLAYHVPDLQMTATDISPAALEVARRNAQRQGVGDRVTFFPADLFPVDPGASHYDLVAANLPYIPSDTLAGLDVIRHEPALALDGGEDGLAVIRRFLKQVPARLAPGGMVLLEIEARQGEPVMRIAESVFPNAEITLVKDLAELDRLVVIQTRNGADPG